MCQAISEGGRRCPSHRLDTIHLINHLSQENNIAIPILRNFFIDERRKYRGTVLTDDKRRALMSKISEITPDNINDNHQVDDVTLLAQVAIKDTSFLYYYRLVQSLSTQINQTYFTTSQLFNYYYTQSQQENQNDTASEAVHTYLESFEGFSQDSNAHFAVSDIKSGKMFQPALADNITSSSKPVIKPRIGEMTGLISTGSPLLMGGYDAAYAGNASHMELVLRNDLGTKLSYKNVSESQWQVIAAGGVDAADMIDIIRANSYYRYESQEEMEEASEIRLTNQCQTCGQFVGTTHMCHNRVIRPEISNFALSSPYDAIHLDFDEPDVFIQNDKTPANTEPSSQLLTYQEAKDENEPQTSLSAIIENHHWTGQVVPSGVHARVKSVLSPFLNDLFSSDLENCADNDMIIFSEEPYEFITSIPDNEAFSIKYSPDNKEYTLWRREKGIPSGKYNLPATISEVELDIELENKNEAIRLDMNPHALSSYLPMNAAEICTSMHSALTGVNENNIVTTSSHRIKENRKDKLKFASSDKLSLALDQGRVAISQFEFSGSIITEAFKDAFGYEIKKSDFYTVQGYVALIKNEDNTISLLGADEVSCSCNERNDENCSHMGYILRQMPSIAQSMSPSHRSQDVPVRNTTESSFPSSLKSLVEINEHQNGGREIVFTDEWRDYESGRFINLRQLNSIDKTILNINELSQDQQDILLQPDASLTLAPEAANIHRALNVARAGDLVTVPVSADYTPQTPYNQSYEEYVDPVYNVCQGGVTGSLTFTKDEEGEVSLHSRNLKCFCVDYEETYDCAHVRRTASNAISLLNSTADIANVAQVSARRLSLLNSHVSEMSEISAIRRRQEILGEQIADVNARDMLIQERQDAFLRDTRNGAAYQRMIQIKQDERDAAWVIEKDLIAAHREDMIKRYENFEGIRYSSDTDAFNKVVKQTLSRKRKGESPIVFRTENATNGICADVPGSRSFGVEIEFEFDTNDRKVINNSLRQIGQELFDAALTKKRHQSQYHTASQTGWDGWSFEEDNTVAGEVVSPLMKDTPEHWEQLRLVCDILKRNGAVAKISSGSHVHISTSSLEASPSKHAELVRNFNSNQDLLYRLGSNPSRGTHRGQEWCMPNLPMSADVDTSASYNILDRHMNHGKGLNILNSFADGNIESHAEFRIWDGTLDPAIIQQQVMISAALTQVADQDIEKSGISKKREDREISKIGSHYSSENKNAEPDSADVRSFLDTFFPRQEDRDTVASLFAITKWQKS